MTDDDDRRLLLSLARDAIVARVTGTSMSSRWSTETPREILSRRAGVFVTIHKGDELRGCIGHIGTDQSLGTAVPQCAVAACSADPRFVAVQHPELPELTIELSLLGPFETIHGPDDIEVGRHGLLVEKEASRGLLLPQVATEWAWEADTFLAQTCRKAGLALDAWKTGAMLWRFEADVFSENSLEPERARTRE